MPIGNLPDKNDDSRKIVGLVTQADGYILILNRPNDPPLGIGELAGKGYIIEQFDLRDSELIKNGVVAKQIARAIEDSRNIGFEQGLRFIRNALGVR